MHRTVRAIGLVVSVSWRVSRRRCLVVGCETLGTVLDMLQPVFLALVVHGVVTSDRTRVVLGAAGMSCSVGLMMLLQVVGIQTRLGLVERVGHAFDHRVAMATTTVPTLAHLGSATYHDDVQTLRDKQGALGNAVGMLVVTVNRTLMPVGTVLVAAVADWRLLLLVVFTVPRMLTNGFTARWDARAEEVSAEPNRRAGKLLELSTAAAAGAEARVLDHRHELRRLIADSVRQWRAPVLRAERLTALVTTADSVVYFAAAAAVLGWIVSDALAGATSVGTVALGVMVVQRLQDSLSVLRWASRNLSATIRTVDRLVRLENVAAHARASSRGRRTPPDRLTTGIRLDRVRFRYDGADRDAVDEVSLFLPAGAVVALVGENGSGKSSLVKLLTGMYTPTTGAVLVDGVPLTDLDRSRWQARTTGVFQDFGRFEFVARESIGVGHLPAVDDPGRVCAAARAAAADQVVRSLPAGFDTQLGAAWPGGVDLSGGQWQRLAVARGMMRPRPLLVVLDEPTSALDPTAEHALLERYAATARTAAGEGAVTVVVSHRFSTVATADLVVVLDQGRIAEVGAHGELITADGPYAALYQLQARGYR